MLLAPSFASAGANTAVFDELRAQGFVRARVNGRLYELDELPKLDKQKKHSIDVVVDRFKVRGDLQQRLAESFETALKLADGIALVAPDEERGDDLLRTLRLPDLRSLHQRAGTRCSPSTTRQVPARPAMAWA